jgi:hypothetical protein
MRLILKIFMSMLVVLEVSTSKQKIYLYCLFFLSMILAVPLKIGRTPSPPCSKPISAMIVIKPGLGTDPVKEPGPGFYGSTQVNP